MSSDWGGSDSDAPAKAGTSPQNKTVPKAPPKTKWEGEDEEDDGPVSDWEASSEEEEKPGSFAPVAPPKKKGTLKAKLAEKEEKKAARKVGEDPDYDSDEVLDPKEKARRDKEKELNADLHNATELFGAAALGGTSFSELDALVSFQPRTKEDFQQFSSRIIEFLLKRHQNKPLYASFVEHHVRELAMPLRDVEVRKAASSLTTLANEKQREQREQASGKKKPKAASKPALGAAKAAGRLDTSVYDEALDDFGSNVDDFM